MSIYDTGGNNRKVSYPAAADWDNLAQGTVCGWVRPDDVNNLARSLWAKNPSGWVLQRNGADGSKLIGSVARATTAQSVTTATGVLLAATWQFLALTWDITNGGPRLYVGGLGVAATDVSVSAVDGSGAKSDDSANVVTIGNAATNSNSFPGRHANVMVFNRDLSLAELIAIQFSGRPAVSDGSCLLWAPLYSIGHLEDLSGAHRAGTNTTMVTRQHVPLGWAEYPGFQSLHGPGSGLTNYTLAADTIAYSVGAGFTGYVMTADGLSYTIRLPDIDLVADQSPAVDASTTRGQGFASRRTLPYRGPSVVTRYEDGVAVETVNPFEEIGAPQRERTVLPPRPEVPTKTPPALPGPVGKEIIGRRDAAPVIPELPTPVEPDLGRRVRERKRREIQAFNAAVIARIVGEMSDL